MQRRTKGTIATGAVLKNPATINHFQNSSNDTPLQETTTTSLPAVNMQEPQVVMRGALQFLFPHNHQSIPYFIPCNKSLQNFTASVTSRRKRRRQPQRQAAAALSIDEEEATVLTTTSNLNPPLSQKETGMRTQSISLYNFLANRQVLFVLAVGEDFWTRPDAYSVKLYRRLMQTAAYYQASDTHDTHDVDVRRAAILLLVPSSICQSLDEDGDDKHQQNEQQQPASTDNAPAGHFHDHHDAIIKQQQQQQQQLLLPPWLHGAGAAILPNTFLTRTACKLPPHTPSLAVIDLKQQQVGHPPPPIGGTKQQYPQRGAHTTTSSSRMSTFLWKGECLTLSPHEELALEWNSPSFCAQRWIKENQSALTCSQKALVAVLFPSLGDTCTIS